MLEQDVWGQAPDPDQIAAAGQPHHKVVGLDIAVQEALVVHILNSRDLEGARGMFEKPKLIVAVPPPAPSDRPAAGRF